MVERSDTVQLIANDELSRSSFMSVTVASDDDLEAGIKKDPESVMSRAELIAPYLAARAYHIPGNDWYQDWFQFVYANNHPIFGLCLHYKHHPVSNGMRIVVFLGTILAGLAIYNIFYLYFLWRDGMLQNTMIETGITIGVNGDEYLTSKKILVKKWKLYLWTLGSLINSIFNTSIWTLAACGIFAPGGKFAHLGHLRWMGRVATFCIVFLVGFVALILMVIRAADGVNSAMELNFGALDESDFEDALRPQKYMYLKDWIIQVALSVFVYDAIISTVFFSGILGCGGEFPILGGRPYELRKLEEEQRKSQRKLRKSRRSSSVSADETSRRDSTADSVDSVAKSKRRSLRPSIQVRWKKSVKQSEAVFPSEEGARKSKRRSVRASTSVTDPNLTTSKAASRVDRKKSKRKAASDLDPGSDGTLSSSESSEDDGEPSTPLRKVKRSSVASVKEKIKKSVKSQRAISLDDCSVEDVASGDDVRKSKRRAVRASTSVTDPNLKTSKASSRIEGKKSKRKAASELDPGSDGTLSSSESSEDDGEVSTPLRKVKRSSVSSEKDKKKKSVKSHKAVALDEESSVKNIASGDDIRKSKRRSVRTSASDRSLNSSAQMPHDRKKSKRESTSSTDSLNELVPSTLDTGKAVDMGTPSDQSSVRSSDVVSMEKLSEAKKKTKKAKKKEKAKEIEKEKKVKKAKKMDKEKKVKKVKKKEKDKKSKKEKKEKILTFAKSETSLEPSVADVLLVSFESKEVASGTGTQHRSKEQIKLDTVDLGAEESIGSKTSGHRADTLDQSVPISASIEEELEGKKQKKDEKQEMGLSPSPASDDCASDLSVPSIENKEVASDTGTQHRSMEQIEIRAGTGDLSAEECLDVGISGHPADILRQSVAVSSSIDELLEGKKDTKQTEQNATRLDPSPMSVECAGDRLGATVENKEGAPGLGTQHRSKEETTGRAGAEEKSNRGTL